MQYPCSRDLGFKEFALCAASAVVLVLAVVGAAFSATSHLIGRFEADREAWRAAAQFKPGQLVETVIDSRPGMVVRATCHSGGCYYRVRFSASMERTATRWGPDGDIETRPYALVEMQEFELREVK